MEIEEQIETRQLEKRLYNLFRSKINDIIDLPKNWDDFIIPLRQQIKYEGVLNEKERQVLWQAATSFKIGWYLIEDKKLNEHALTEHAIETGGFQLILYGTFLQLKGWVHKLQGANRQLQILGKIKTYIQEDFNLKELRNAIVHSGDNENNTFFILSSDQKIKFKTKQTDDETSIDIFKVLFASLLLWTVFSEWATNKIK